MKKKISVIFGTRPEAIKLCPLVLAMKADPAFDCRVCVTGQHREMLQQVLDVFGVVPDDDLALMTQNQSLAGLTARAMLALDEYLEREKPDAVVVQGDTTTVLCGALAAFYHHIPVAHVEAGLRTGNLYSPWPEEANRRLATRLAKWHFCPTEGNRANLLREGIDPRDAYVVGNTVIDALQIAKGRVECGAVKSMYSPGFKKHVLITGHRRENFGDGFVRICTAVRRLADEHRDVEFVYPVHLNPNVKGPVDRMLVGLENVRLLTPQSYLPFVGLMMGADIILTDSGGVQEEAPSLGKPVLVMRDTTERPEAVAAGVVKMVGTDVETICKNVNMLFANGLEYAKMATKVNPYGDGKSVSRIVATLKKGLQ